MDADIQTTLRRLIDADNLRYALRMYWLGRADKLRDDEHDALAWVTLQCLEQSVAPTFTGFKSGDVQFVGLDHLQLSVVATQRAAAALRILSAPRRVAAQALPTGKRSPMTGKPIFDLVDATGDLIEQLHVAENPDNALRIYTERPAKAALAAARPSSFQAPVPNPPPAEPRSGWQLVRKIDDSDSADDFFYHVTSYASALRILREGLVPNVSAMFTAGVYPAHSRGKAFLTDRDGVNFWRERVEQQLHANFDRPPAVTVVRILKTAVAVGIVVQQDDIGSRDAGALAYFVEGAVKCGPPQPAKPSLEDVRRKWAAAGIEHFMFEKAGTIELAQIVVPTAARGQGIGKGAMKSLAAYADATGQRIVLTPSSDFGGSKTRLVAFYRSFGFVENKGRHKDFTTTARMIRAPAAVPSKSNDDRAALEDVEALHGEEPPKRERERGG